MTTTNPNTDRGRRLAELRDDQRRRLWAIPKVYFDDLRWTKSAPPEPDELDQTDLELYLREAAETRLSLEARSWLDSRARSAGAGYARASLNSLTGEFVKEVKASVSDSFDEPAPQEFKTTTDPIVVSTLTFLVIAVLADLIATDSPQDAPSHSAIAGPIT